MKMINIQAAKTHLSRIVEEVAMGEEIILAKAGKPIAKLVPYVVARPPRTGGLLKGKIQESADCWAPDLDLDAAMGNPSIYPNLDDSDDGHLQVAEDKP